jgi:hypothetical protein
VQGPRHIEAFFKRGSHKTASDRNGFLLQRLFDLSPQAAQYHINDVSGRGIKPSTGNYVPSHDRIDFLNHQCFLHLLTGPGYLPFCRRFEYTLVRRLQHLPIAEEWQSVPDFMQIFHHEVAPTVVDGAYGTALLRLNPTFIQDFWEFDRVVDYIHLGVPRIFAPRPYAARDRLLNSIEAWRVWIQALPDDEAIDLNSDRPTLATQFVIDRQAMYDRMKGYRTRDVASEDLGFIWA